MTHGGTHGPGAASTADGSLSSVEEYQSAILAAIAPLAPASLELAAAEGCVLAEDVTAAVALPSFDNSSMDGYAVLAADVAGASQESPATLRVTGEIAAGDTGIYRLVPGTAIKIMTGAQLPAGADAVVPVEWTDDGIAQVRVYQSAEPGNAVRYAGGDAAEGETLLSAGTRLRAMQVAVAASAGRKAVSVRPRPRVVVLSTGNELTEPGTPLVPGRIWDSNSYMIAAAVRETGAVAYRRSVVPDDPAGVLPALEEQLIRADLLITTGGVSMGGEHDVVKAALRELGTVTFRKVAMQPGMPQGFGVIGEGGAGGLGAERRVPIFTLPGNPVSAYVSFQLFVRPALAALQGADDLSLPSVQATLTGPARSPAGRRSYLRGVLDGSKVTPLSGQQSHQIASLGRANALIVIPEWETQLPAGDTVDVLILP
ncbi:molybdopterin molybdenumtransferase MoeA [Trebonia kvetii]|uniref:Molybdopterin molybdenumtransferase n=1 Tax=Trebonia kvetii TaxID=2480626 RepID=A0A6P2BZ91_9ACTN|nr:gephyrin-like molybdotransferase Glp [Trebonia kvetii]TVZ04027.1 molybdopterin molybdenumtransferase MoeA [Trebonia kvetii]